MMRLLNTGTKELRDFQLDTVPPYLILSHRWEEDEVSYKDLTNPNRGPSELNGWAKLRSFCCLAEEDGWEWFWMDTCCIDRGNMNEVSEAINSMYQWYRDAEFCIAYLADVSVVKDETGRRSQHVENSEWFKRGWTLQELLAPREVIFYDSGWRNLGSRTRFNAEIYRAARISVDDLSNHLQASVAAKMSWAAGRTTSKKEDIAYSLLGLFNVNMPLIYGEGEYKAFQRLQYEIVRSGGDESIFAWKADDALDFYSIPAPGLLAPHPRYFSDSGDLVRIDLSRANVHTPRIRFDGMVWTVKRTVRECDDRKVLAPDEVPYIVPLACSKKPWNPYAPAKLKMMTSLSHPPRRLCSTSIEFFNEDEMHSIQGSGFRTHRLVQDQPGPKYFPSKPRNIRHGFTLRLSVNAQLEFPRISGYGPDAELHTEGEGGYIISASEDNTDDVGGLVGHEEGTVIDVTCNSSASNERYLVLEVNEQTFWTGLDSSNNPSRGEHIILGESIRISTAKGQNISISPKHGRRGGQNEIIIDIDCN